MEYFKNMKTWIDFGKCDLFFQKTNKPPFSIHHILPLIATSDLYYWSIINLSNSFEIYTIILSSIPIDIQLRFILLIHHNHFVGQLIFMLVIYHLSPLRVSWYLYYWHIIYPHLYLVEIYTFDQAYTPIDSQFILFKYLIQQKYH